MTRCWAFCLTAQSARTCFAVSRLALFKQAPIFLPIDYHPAFTSFCRDPARAMLSPGSATALVNAALEWLQPQGIQALTSSLPPPRVDSRLDPNQGRCRQGRAAAASPAALGPFCSALAAVLQFLGAHIQARQVRAACIVVTTAVVSRLSQLTSLADHESLMIS